MKIIKNGNLRDMGYPTAIFKYNSKFLWFATEYLVCTSQQDGDFMRDIKFDLESERDIARDLFVKAILNHNTLIDLDKMEIVK